MINLLILPKHLFVYLLIYNSAMSSILGKKVTLLLYFLLALVYVSGLFIPLMENDSAQHATMAMHMYLENDFINLMKGFNDYLDKPHMHFWLAALSFKIFGVTHWAYRIPALLFTMIGAFSSYKLSKEFYGINAGHIASLIFLSAQAIILANHDVRTDAVLTGASIFAIWQLVLYVNYGKLKQAILGSIGLGIAFSTKGQLAVFIVGIMLFSYLLYNRKWKSSFNWKVLVGVIAFFLTCLPMLYAYYHQFDLHPEKVINGHTHISGIRFIFWDQSFNRLTGTGFGSNSTDYFFFFHTLVWAFLPWGLLAYVAIFYRSKEFVKNKFKYIKNVEFLTIGGFWIVMIVLNLSKSKLPHYMNSLFPILAVLLAGYLVNLYNKSDFKMLKILLGIQYFSAILGSLLAVVLLIFVFGTPNPILLFVNFLLFSALVYTFIKKQEITKKIIVMSVLFSVFVNFSLNTHFYPKLLEYQAGNNMVKIIKEKKIDPNSIYMIKGSKSWSLNFYTVHETPEIAISEMQSIKGKWLFVYKRDFDKLQKQNTKWDESIEVNHHRITMLTASFLNPKTRPKVLNKAYLLHIN
ncbi:MAG TPA: glycosyltransferase family 39 protein [Bacteroidia bacterium]|nr:glycosyltransferase family 39 protein [Bacteroidia bacterium]